MPEPPFFFQKGFAYEHEKAFSFRLCGFCAHRCCDDVL